jgi:uncharacterized protein with PQ loop repeat
MIKLITAIISVVLGVSTGIPQVYHTYKTKKTNDLSIYYLILWTLCSISWFSYGYLDNDIALIVCDGIILFQNIYLLSAKIYYDKLLCFKQRALIEDL